jgi:hypothetical protein
MNVRAFTTSLVMALLVAVSSAQLPPISWTCPMHPDVLEDEKGKCNICGMNLEPVRLVSMWTCPVHAVIEETKPGRCRICKRDLVQMIAALTWTCASNREINQLERGRCADGSLMIARYTPRPHGDHNPKHGGIFFMAPDNWHHIEGTYPAPGRFRVYVYDDYSKPLNTTEARKVRGRLVTKEAFDPKTGTTRELASAPLVLARNGAFFEARFDPLALPAQMTAKISFKAGEKESRFDFTFPAFSKDQPASAVPVASASTPATDRQKPDAAATAAPQTSPETDVLLADLKAKQAEVESLVKNGTLAGIYLPALQAKDIALEIQTRERLATSTGAINQQGLEAQVKQLVVAAYQLDNYGDLGDSGKVDEAYRRFSSAISSLESLIAGKR